MNARRAIGVLVLLGAAGCAGRVGGSPTGGSGGTGTGTGTGGSGAGTGSGGSPNFSLACSTTQLGTPQLRLLTRTELQNSIDTAFPDIVGQWTASLPSNTVSEHGFDNDASAAIGGQLAGAVLDMGVSVGRRRHRQQAQHRPAVRRQRDHQVDPGLVRADLPEQSTASGCSGGRSPATSKPAT